MNERDFGLVNEGFLNRQDTPSDMWEYMSVLRRYARGADSIVEFGTSDRANSTFALMAGRPLWMRCYDIKRYEPTFSYVEKAARDAGIDFAFRIQSSIVEVITQIDLLFIDDEHTYAQLSKELEMHGGRVNKWIIIHDTTEFAAHDEGGNGRGLWPAIQEFMDSSGDWEVRDRFHSGYGLTVLQRKGFVSKFNTSEKIS